MNGCLGTRVCQDAPSFGNSLYRCSIFCQVTILSSVCVCVCVWAFGFSCMSGCCILWQLPVKMLHLLSGDPFVLCMCMCVCLGVWVLWTVNLDMVSQPVLVVLVDSEKLGKHGFSLSSTLVETDDLPLRLHLLCR